MTKREFGTLLFRLLGLYFIGLSLHFVPVAFQEWMQWQGTGGPIAPGPLLPWLDILIPASPFILLSGFGFGLFILAPSFSLSIFKDAQPLDISPELANLRAAAFTLAGLILIGQAIPDLLTAFVHYRSDAANLPPNATLPFAQVVKLIFGVYLMNCGGWHLVPPHKWGRDPSWPDESQSSSDAEP